jgi:hypothetical protein
MKKYKRIFKEQDLNPGRVFQEDINYSDEIFVKSMKDYRLYEKTFSIGKDVDFIYKIGFKKVIDDFQSEGILPPYDIYLETDSSQLKSKDCVQAHRNNPVNIYGGTQGLGSYYSSKDKVISISINFDAVKYYPKKHLMTPNSLKAIDKEISEIAVKETIYHELSHWISDSLYNTYIGNLVARAKNISEDDPNWKEKIKKIMSMGKVNVNMTHFEIDAQIHAIKQAKRMLKKEWDEMTFLDLFYEYNSLRAIAKILYKIGEDVYREWFKDLVKRMNREGLLGKNMRVLPEYKMIESYEIERLLLV